MPAKLHKSTDEVRETTEDLSAILNMLQSLQKDMELMKLDNKELKELITSQQVMSLSSKPTISTPSKRPIEESNTGQSSGSSTPAAILGIKELTIKLDDRNWTNWDFELKGTVSLVEGLMEFITSGVTLPETEKLLETEKESPKASPKASPIKDEHKDAKIKPETRSSPSRKISSMVQKWAYFLIMRSIDIAHQDLIRNVPIGDPKGIYMTLYNHHIGSSETMKRNLNKAFNKLHLSERNAKNFPQFASQIEEEANKLRNHQGGNRRD